MGNTASTTTTNNMYAYVPFEEQWFPAVGPQNGEGDHLIEQPQRNFPMMEDIDEEELDLHSRDGLMRIGVTILMCSVFIYICEYVIRG